MKTPLVSKHVTNWAGNDENVRRGNISLPQHFGLNRDSAASSTVLGRRCSGRERSAVLKGATGFICRPYYDIPRIYGGAFFAFAFSAMHDTSSKLKNPQCPPISFIAIRGGERACTFPAAEILTARQLGVPRNEQY